MNRLNFMVCLVESLVQNYEPVKVIRKRRSAEQRHIDSLSPASIAGPSHTALSPEDGHKMIKLPVGKKRNCIAGHAKRVRSSYFCPKCDAGICPGCYASFHNKIKS